MPTLNMPPKKKKSTFHDNSVMREVRRKAYNNTTWRKTRDAYLHEHPICEECLKHGRIYGGGGDRGTIQVHHKKSPFINGGVEWDLMLDSDNLQTLCAQCHGELHSNKVVPNPSELIDILDELLLKDWEPDEEDKKIMKILENKMKDEN